LNYNDDFIKVVLLEIDINGAHKIKDNFPKVNIVSIVPPSLDILRMRIKER